MGRASHSCGWPSHPRAAARGDLVRPGQPRSRPSWHHAFVTGFNTIALASVGVATVDSVAGYALARSRDFVSVGG